MLMLKISCPPLQITVYIENEDSIQIGENYVTLIVEGNTNTWYISTCSKKNDDATYEMDHLHRVDKAIPIHGI